MSRWLLDIECDDLLPKVTKMHIFGGYNFDTNEIRYWLEGDLSWQEEMDKATLVVGHNWRGYDEGVLLKLFGYRFKKHTKIHDTLIMSRVLNYRRFGSEGHSMEKWGDYFRYPKLPSPDFKVYSEEMQIYWERDIRLNMRIYDKVMQEFMALFEKEPKIQHYMRAEHAVSWWCTLAQIYGWPFDRQAGVNLYGKLEAQMELAHVALSDRLGLKTVPKDKSGGEVIVKKPKWVKSGAYDAHTANWFGIDPWSGYEGEERMVEGEFCRVEFLPLSLDSVADVKTFLYRNDWQPTEWNFKVDEETGKKVKSSPKITEDSLEFLGGDGKLYVDFLTAKSRFGILKTWLSELTPDDTLHGDCHTIGTPSMRARHSIIVNIPSSEAAWGKEMRALFKCLPGWKLVGCDSASNQARGLAHYLNNPSFTDALINGDIHVFNAGILDSVLQNMGVNWTDFIIKSGVTADEKHTLEENIAKRKRAAAKRILYAFLFGASGGKLWSYIFGSPNDQKGKILKDGFTKSVPGFKALLEKLEKVYGATSRFGEGYIGGLAGNRIYVDSFHKLLVYLLQACEKATCSAALMLTMERLEEAGIPYRPCIMMHDEIDFQVPEQFAEQAAAIGKQAFVDGPKLFGVDIMDGDAKIGNNWLEVH